MLPDSRADIWGKQGDQFVVPNKQGKLSTAIILGSSTYCTYDASADTYYVKPVGKVMYSTGLSETQIGGGQESISDGYWVPMTLDGQFDGYDLLKNVSMVYREESGDTKINQQPTTYWDRTPDVDYFVMKFDPDSPKFDKMAFWIQFVGGDFSDMVYGPQVYILPTDLEFEGH